MKSFFQRIKTSYIYLLSGILISTSINLFTDFYINTLLLEAHKNDIVGLAILFLISAISMTIFADRIDELNSQVQKSDLPLDFSEKWITYFKLNSTIIYIFFIISLAMLIWGILLLIC
jgi:hypothetical protein